MHRREFLRKTSIATSAGIVGLAGCTGGGGDGGDGGDGGGDGQDLSGPVPEEYRTATSQGGTKRNPDSLQSKASVEYQSQPKNNQQCSDCIHYIEDKNGDGLGACALVEGYIEPNGWCALFSPVDN